MSEEHKQYLKKQRTRKIVIRIIQIGILILIFGIWELSAYLEWADPFITSSPSRVVKSIANLYTVERNRKTGARALPDRAEFPPESGSRTAYHNMGGSRAHGDSDDGADDLPYHNRDIGAHRIHVGGRGKNTAHAFDGRR